METEWVGFGISLGGWLIMAGMAGDRCIRYSAGGFTCQTRWLKTGRTGIKSPNPTVSILLHLGLRHRQSLSNVTGFTGRQSAQCGGYTTVTMLVRPVQPAGWALSPRRCWFSATPSPWHLFMRGPS